MQLKLVATAESKALHAVEGEDGALYGTVILKRLLKPWTGQGDRVVCADSYFALVGAAEELEKWVSVSLESSRRQRDDSPKRISRPLSYTTVATTVVCTQKMPTETQMQWHLFGWMEIVATL